MKGGGGCTTELFAVLSPSRRDFRRFLQLPASCSQSPQPAKPLLCTASMLGNAQKSTPHITRAIPCVNRARLHGGAHSSEDNLTAQHELASLCPRRPSIQGRVLRDGEMTEPPAREHSDGMGDTSDWSAREADRSNDSYPKLSCKAVPVMSSRRLDSYVSRHSSTKLTRLNHVKQF